MNNLYNDLLAKKLFKAGVTPQDAYGLLRMVFADHTQILEIYDKLAVLWAKSFDTEERYFLTVGDVQYSLPEHVLEKYEF